MFVVEEGKALGNCCVNVVREAALVVKERPAYLAEPFIAIGFPAVESHNH